MKTFNQKSYNNRLFSISNCSYSKYGKPFKERSITDPDAAMKRSFSNHRFGYEDYVNNIHIYVGLSSFLEESDNDYYSCFDSSSIYLDTLYDASDNSDNDIDEEYTYWRRLY